MCRSAAGFGDCTLQPGYARREEIYSTLRDDENTHGGRLQCIGGIKSNHFPVTLTNKWVKTVKVVIVMNGRNLLPSKISSRTLVATGVAS